MRVVRRLIGALTVAIALGPATAHADVIQCTEPSNPACHVVAEFVWSRDTLFGFGDILALNNLSAGTSFGGLFSEITLSVSPAADPSVLFAGTTLDAGNPPLESGSLFDVESAVLTFVFQNSGFTASLLATDLLDDGFGTAFTSTLVYAQELPAAVPEPSTLLLLAGGMVGLRFARRQSEVVAKADKRPAHE